MGELRRCIKECKFPTKRGATMPLKTRLTEMLGIEHPLVMGGLTGVGTVELAAAVSNAGGLGMFTAHNAGSPEAARREIRRLKTLTSKPFGVNLTVLPTIGPPPPYEEYCRVFIEEGVPVVETAGSNPSRWITMFKAASPPIICIHKCVSIRHALKAEKLGVDIISLDGFECARANPSDRHTCCKACSKGRPESEQVRGPPGRGRRGQFCAAGQGREDAPRAVHLQVGRKE